MEKTRYSSDLIKWMKHKVELTLKHTIGLNAPCELRCGCCGPGCGWDDDELLRGVGGSGRLACGGSGTTIKRCGSAGRDGGPGSSNTGCLSRVCCGGCAGLPLRLACCCIGDCGFCSFCWAAAMRPSWICWKLRRNVSPPGAWIIDDGSPAICGSSSSLSEPE